ncbi:MAG TPA: DNA methyltransferase [Candidatus Dormibacteraeota bacterium]|nr:DNA methyltransferase [Candidatus Dormibacteraeota bacterium]
MTPYYSHAGITIYHGDCREVLPGLDTTLLVTDPPYPNNGGHFEESIEAARSVLSDWNGTTALVFWSELEFPPVRIPLVAVHIWRRATSWARPYEPIFHFELDGRKRRSEIKVAGAVFDGVFAGCHQFLGHPTQKNEFVMKWMLAKIPASEHPIVDPFMGVGTTIEAAKKQGRRAIGIEIE